jgi:ankyrin repeat protein
MGGGNSKILVYIKTADDKDTERFIQILKKRPQKSFVNYCERDGTTALHKAAERGLLECVKLLIKYHANPNLLLKGMCTYMYV